MGKIGAGGLFEAATSDHVSPMTAAKTGQRRALVYWTRHLAMLPHRPRRQNQRPRLWCRLYLPKAIGD
jgi:hypothetical protein